MPSGSASWSPGDARLWGPGNKREGLAPPPPQDGGILGDAPEAPQAQAEANPQSAVRPRPDAKVRSGVPRPTSGIARTGFGASDVPATGGSGTPERPQRHPKSSSTWDAGSARAGTLPLHGGGSPEPLPRAVSIAASPSPSPADSALEREWTVWADTARSRVLSSEDFDLEAASRRDISTWADFWAFWSDVKAGRIELGDGSNLCVFARGVKPTWEDSQAHGKWVVLIDKRETLSRLLLLLQALLEGQSANLRHICGVQLSMRPQRDCLAVWNLKGGHSSFVKRWEVE